MKKIILLLFVLSGCSEYELPECCRTIIKIEGNSITYIGCFADNIATVEVDSIDSYYVGQIECK